MGTSRKKMLHVFGWKDMLLSKVYLFWWEGRKGRRKEGRKCIMKEGRKEGRKEVYYEGRKKIAP